MNWGKWIIVAFVLFATFIGVLVTVCVRQDVNLVSKEYYKEELVYQAQLERIQNANALSEKPTLNVRTDRTLEIKLPQDSKVDGGEVIIFSPSNPKQDARFKIKSSTGGDLQFDLSDMKAGHYKAKITWRVGSKEFYIEDSIFI